MCRGEQRKYYRFRSAKYYGGIATADCVGCNLNCAFCWSETPRKHPEKAGKWYTPHQVVDKLIDIAEDKQYHLLRVSGNEPTLGKTHLLRLLELVPSKYRFILETNGVLLNEAYIEELRRIGNVHVRVSLKAGTPQLFAKVTGAPADAFEKPFRAIRLLDAKGVSYHVSIVKEVLREGDLAKIQKELAGCQTRLEFEHLRYYPHVVDEMERRSLKEFIRTKEVKG